MRCSARSSYFRYSEVLREASLRHSQGASKNISAQGSGTNRGPHYITNT